MISISDRIKELRTKGELSAIALADKLGWAKYSIDKFESGKQTPSNTQVAELSDFFGVSQNYLRAETNDPTRQDSWMDMAYDFENDKSATEHTKTLDTEKNNDSSNEPYSPSMFAALLESPMAKEIIRKIVIEELNKLK